MASPELRASQKNHAECVKYSLPFCNRGRSFVTHLYRQKRFMQYQASDLGSVYKFLFREQENNKLHCKMPVPSIQETILMDNGHLI